MLLQAFISVIVYISLTCEASDDIGFTATVYDARAKQGENRLLLPFVIHNDGDGYNPTTGVFTASEDGLYDFIVIANVSENSAVKVGLYHNNEFVIAATESNKLQAGEISPNWVTIELKEGDTVDVRTQAAEDSEDTLFVSFTGYLSNKDKDDNDKQED